MSILHIEAVTVCVNYADFLHEAAKNNAGLLDRWVIVTSPDDEQTREVCRIHDLECVTSNDWRRATVHGRPFGPDGFNKGRMVDRGLSMLSENTWRLHLDADIVLPHQFRRMLEGAHLDESKIYGCDRLMITSEAQWRQLQKSDWMNHTHCSVNLPNGVTVGTRWALQSSGYIPIGFFQLWHGSADEWRGRRVRPYPIAHGDCCRTDVQHALQWDRRNRELLPEIVVAHLDSVQSKLRANWSGRTTPQFGLFPWRQHHDQHRHSHHHHDPSWGGGR